MRSIFLLLLLLALSACTTQPITRSPIIDGDDEARMTVRKVEVQSDIAVIRPDYQIVIGVASRVVPMDRTVRWEVVAQKSVSPPPNVAKRAPSPVEPKPPAAPRDQTVYLDETHFDFGSAKLNKFALQVLNQASAEIEKLAPKKMSIIGHADSVGSDASNQKLSERRAEAVFSYLKSKGLKIETVERVGFGESAPIASNSTAEGRAKNRRAEIMATVSK